MDTTLDKPVDFIRQRIERDLTEGRVPALTTRFPPEPNGYLHIGHAKAVCLNFGVAEEFEGGRCYMRFDDTNPSRESVEYVNAILHDVRWLGFDWGDRLTHASDYFERLFDYAVTLIKNGKAYVDSLDPKTMREYRGSLTEPGKNSPYRGRSVAENLDLFQRMRAGEFADGEHVLRARIDMASPNINMRDPVMYRIMHRAHPVAGESWCIYPLYDFTHCLSDAIEGITHSLCSLEFEDHRPLYDWFIAELDFPEPRPQQIEFSRLNLTYTVTSKRILQQLVAEKHVRGWDDPRMPTLSGLRRRGYTPRSLRDFCARSGVTKVNHNIEYESLESCIRDDLGSNAPRAFAVLDPLKVTIENYPDGQTEMVEAPNHPQDPAMGSRELPFSKILYIERDDFMEQPSKKYFRLAPGKEVRFKYAYYLTCVDVIKDPNSGEVLELICQYDPNTRGGRSEDGRKIKGTIHWVSAAHAVNAEVRLYDRLFKVADPAVKQAGELAELLNPDSLNCRTDCKLEPLLASAPSGNTYQFERLGYFCVDTDSTGEAPVFNRTVTLRDTWAKVAGRQ